MLHKKLQDIQGKVNLILTSPPFPLNKKKRYGNMKGEIYLKWFTDLAPLFANLLADDGSIVIELGNAWEPKRPVQSLLPLQSLLGFVSHEKANLRLIQQFVCYNPSRLPSPAQWVTIEQIRAVDSYTNVWWMAKSDFPKADNSRPEVLRPYSKSMQRLLKSGKFNAGRRPSQHKISDSGFLNDRGGSIAHNFIELESLTPGCEPRLPNAFSMSNTSSNDFFSRICREKGIEAHPARMQVGLAKFFIEYLTNPDDLVLDPFGGSNTTGYAAALCGRRWLTIEEREDYVEQSRLRFEDPALRYKK
nr:site-specific DNA-methyltransferase [Alkalinema sp. FACHB-956]